MNYLMKINIISTETFEKEYKRLKKKYPSLTDDLRVFKQDLINNPEIGVDLGNHVRKIRVQINKATKWSKHPAPQN